MTTEVIRVILIVFASILAGYSTFAYQRGEKITAIYIMVWATFMVA